MSQLQTPKEQHKDAKAKTTRNAEGKSSDNQGFICQATKKRASKTLNQTIKRKNEQIKKLKEQFSSSNQSQVLQTAKEQASALNKRNYMLKLYHRKKRQSSSLPVISCEQDLELKCHLKDMAIASLQEENVLLEEKIEDMEDMTKTTKSDGKGYNTSMRMMVYDAIVDQVPTTNIPHLINKFAMRCGVTLSDIPHRTTVEKMTRELGSIADLQTAETILANENCTLGFDATTQEGNHVNSIHVTTRTDCLVVAIDELPGGTAEDYSSHIINSFDNLANVHAYFTGEEQQDSKQKMIENISNTLTDRCAANHAAIQLVEQAWNKSLNELNCHLHPLDSIATKTRSALRKCEGDIPGVDKGLWGKDCVAANIVLSMNKMRYKDAKGDPRGFVTFLQNENLPRGILPRYRGNRLHILFRICGILIQHYEKFKTFLQKGTACGGLRNSLLNDFSSDIGHVEMQVLGLLGKLLSGPWMKCFYRNAEDQIDHVEGITVVKKVVELLNVERDPLDLLGWTTDIFGKEMDASDATLQALRQAPKEPQFFKVMMGACIHAIVDVLERQYRKYFDVDITEKLKQETKSARTHNIDAEEVMGMFSAAKQRAPNATICFLSCKMRAQKNRTVEYLDVMPNEQRDAIVKKATKLGLEQQQKRRKNQNDLRVELSKRQAAKQQARETKF